MLLLIAAKRLEYLQKHINETQGNWQYLIPENSFYNFKENLIESTKEFWFLPSFSMAVDALLEDDYQHIPQVIEYPVVMYSQMLGSKLQLIETNYKAISREVALALLARNFNQHLTSSNAFINIEKADSLMQVFGKKPTLINYFKNQVDKVLSIKPGNLAPSFTLPNVNGQMVSLNDFKGKVVLLLFWGTWCPPCLASMPKYIELQEYFSNQNIVFVFISLEARVDDVEMWRTFVLGTSDFSKRLLNGKPLPGVHVVAQGGFKNPQVQQYAVTYAPSYVLIDFDGKIVSPRANLDENLIEQIEELLNKD
jgi:peroxiredoxin